MMEQTLRRTCGAAGSPGLRRKLLDVLLFQAGWFAAVLGAASGLAWLGPAAILGILVIHLVGAANRRKEAWLLLVALLIGGAFESLLLATGWVGYPGHTSALAPWWLVALWPNFAATLNVALRGLRPQAMLLAALGFVGGPAAYWGGVQLGAMTWLETWPVLLYLALGWAVVTPLLGRLAMRMDGYRHGI